VEVAVGSGAEDAVVLITGDQGRGQDRGLERDRGRLEGGAPDRLEGIQMTE